MRMGRAFGTAGRLVLLVIDACALRLVGRCPWCEEPIASNLWDPSESGPRIINHHAPVCEAFAHFVDAFFNALLERTERAG